MKFKKQIKKKQASETLECEIYKSFPFWHFLGLLIFWIVIVLIISKFNFLIPRRRYTARRPRLSLSITQSIKVGALFGFLFHLPSYASALIMNFMRKPIFRFDAHGFYYTPQIWSKSKLYAWGSVSDIKIENTGKKKEDRLVRIYLIDGDHISIKEKILPINCNQLLKIFRKRLNDYSIKVLK